MKTSRCLASLRWGALVVVCLLTGCGSFNGDFDSSIKAGVPADDIAGPWTGKWYSEPANHGGKLRAIFTRGSGEVVHTRYHAVYGGVLTFEYAMDMQVTRDGDRYVFKGETDLGKMAGGVYTFEGFATPTEFRATYVTTSKDHGAYEMTRPPPPE